MSDERPYNPKASTFREWIEDRPGARFRPGPGRYHLYVAYACPWAHRTLIVRALKGLEDVIGVTAVHHVLDPRIGWVFAPERPDPLHGAERLGELYRRADPGFDGRITVPVLWDGKTGTIVNNESAEIMRMLNDQFDAWARHPEVDLYPEPLRARIDAWNARIFEAANRGVYQAGFARAQPVYAAACERFFTLLDELDAHLATHRYLVGDRPTEADWRLFPTLLRFEWVYHTLFKCNLKRLADYPRLFAYARELYQWPGIAQTVNESHTRDGYFTSMRDLNPSGIVPLGPRVDFMAPHGRERFARARAAA